MLAQVTPSDIPAIFGKYQRIVQQREHLAD
jgi:hypothetical protein